MRLISFLVFLAIPSLRAQQCDCAHIPWTPKACFRKCQAAVINSSSKDELTNTLGLPGAVADDIWQKKSGRTVTSIEDLNLSDKEAVQVNRKFEKLSEADLHVLFPNGKMTDDDFKDLANVRAAIESDKSISTAGKNVKIISNQGTVTLKGNVSSQRDKEEITRKAVQMVGNDKINSDLRVDASKERTASHK